MKLSVIVPVYNLEEYISITLDSLLSINFSEDYEIIVVNDGSKDRSGEIVEQYQQRHHNIRLFTIGNKGVSNARNFGIQQAAGQFITFLDGDDTVDPNFFGKAVMELESGGYDFVQGNYLVVNDQGAHQEQIVKQDMILTNTEMFFRFFLGQNKLIHNAVWGKVFQAKVLKDTLFDAELIVSEDQKFVFDILCKANKIKLLSHHAVNYIQRNGSAVHIYNEYKEKNKLAVLDYFSEKITQSDILMNLKLHQIRIYQGLYRYYTRIGDSQADEVYRMLLEDYETDIQNIRDAKIRIRCFMLKHFRFLLDECIRRR